MPRRIYMSVSGQNRHTRMYGRKTFDSGSKLSTIVRGSVESIDDYWRDAKYALEDNTVETVDCESEVKSEDLYVEKNKIHASVQSDTLFDIENIRENLSTKKLFDLDHAERSEYCKISSKEQQTLELTKNNTHAHDTREEIPKCDTLVKNSDTCFKKYGPSIEYEAGNIKNFHKEDVLKNDLSTGLSFSSPRRGLRNIINLPGSSILEINVNTEQKERHGHTENELFNLNGEKIAVTNVPGMYSEKSSFKPLVASGGMETAVLFLNSMTFIKPERATCDFSVFIIKGTVWIEIEQSKIVLKRGSVCVIGKNTAYSINNPSRTRCTLLLAYSIT